MLFSYLLMSHGELMSLGGKSAIKRLAGGT